MAIRIKASRWPGLHAERLLLPLALLAGAAHAAGAGPEPATAPIAGAADASLAGANGQDVYLDLTLNGSAHGLAHFGDRGGELWASPAALRQLGFILPAGTPDPVRLQSIAGLQVQYDRAEQRVTLTAPLSLLNLPETTLAVPGIKPGKVTSSPGLLLNYDLYGTQGTGGTSSLSAFTELRGFGPWGVLSSTALSQQARANGGAWQRQSVRLDTAWSQSWPDKMLTLRVGDTITDALSWTRATRIGGIQIGSNFALQPYTVTTPIPALLGSAALPSQIDLYVNGMRQYNGQVPAGPFQLNTLPNISGAGNAQVVLTNAFGQTTTLNYSLYGTQQLLKKGLSSWSVELGKVRENYGLVSNDYSHNPMASGTWRYGLSNSLTVETHAEATAGLANAGVGGAWLLGQTGGILTGSLARSSGSGAQGSQFGLGYNWSNERFNVAFNATRTAGAYQDVAARYGGLPPRLAGSATVGYNTEQMGSFSLSYLTVRYPQQTPSRYLTAGWFKSLGRSATLSVTVNQDLVNRNLRGVFATLTWALDARTSASVGLQHDDTGNAVYASASRATPTEGGWGWNAAARRGNGQNDAQGQVNYLGPYGRYDAGVNSSSGSTFAYGEAAGALVFMGGHPFAARQIDNSFALVSTDGVPNVPVLLENNRIGTTNSNGQLLVTPLNSYQNNKLSIDTMNLPADLRIDRVNAIATPGDRAGTLVEFDITPVKAALVTLVDNAGKSLPLGSTVHVNGAAGMAIVGYDGEVYLDTLANHNQLAVQTPAGACGAQFDYHKAADGAIPQVGPITCAQEVRP
ncbi:MAG: fimbrial biogenesis outer membrane usher protein [Burkholderiaceae bacterium]|nr:MAG: fimbrial biogenesis outer membrane usher protein [Burkholderiaceae bacterium]